MRLDFRVLWIDDQQKHVKSFAESLRYKLKAMGFDLEVVRVENLADISDVISEHVGSDGIDLVLVDYDLGIGTGDGGDKALSEVRARFPYKEIIFYSAADTEKLRTIAYEAKVDGIVFSTRMSLVDDATQVIENLLRKVMDIDHMRGVVMSATSDIDFLVERTLLAMYERGSQLEKDDFLNVVSDQLRKKLSGWVEDLEKAVGKKSLEPVLKLKHVFSANDRLNSLSKQLDAWKSTTSTYQEKMAEYTATIVPNRNKLAHVMLTRENGTMKLVGAENFSAESLAELRCALLEHRENFQTIAVLADAKF
jgi:DNA-binding NarL/FixJ family response regulator